MGLENGGIDISGAISGGDTLKQELSPVITYLDTIIDRLDKLESKDAKVKIKIDTKDADPEKINSISSALETLEKKIKAPKQKMKYFQSIENAAIDLKKVWNQLVAEVNNGNISFDKIMDSSAATAVLRYANAYEALGGNISEISPEIDELVLSMRQLDKYSLAKGYNFTVSGFEEAFSELKKLQTLGIEFKGFEEAKNDAIELLSLTEKIKEQADNSGRNNSTGVNTNNGSDDVSSDSPIEEEIKREIITLEELEQKLHDVKRVKDQYNSDNEWEIDDIDWDSEISDIERYSAALEKLKEGQKETYDSAKYWRDSAEGHIKDGDLERAERSTRWMDNEIQKYHKYTDQIEYVQEQLNKAVMSYQPAEGPEGESVKVLILLLQNLNNEISQIRQAFGSVDDDNGFKNLLSSMKEVSGQISEMVGKIEILATAFENVNFNVSLNMNGSNNPIQQNAKYGIEARKTVDSLIASYTDLIEVLAKAGYTEDEVLAKAGRNNLNLFNVFEDTGSKSNPAKMNAYLTIIKEYSKVAAQLGVDLSSWDDKWNTTSLDKIVDDTNKIITGEQEAEEQTKRLFDLFGGNNTNIINGNFEVMSNQLTEIKAQLLELTTLLSHGLSLNNLTDESGEIKSEASALDNVKSSVDLVSEAIREKNSLFINEANIVKESVASEINSLQLLIEKINSVQNEIIQLNGTVIAPTIDSVNVNNNGNRLSSPPSSSSGPNRQNVKSRINSLLKDQKYEYEQILKLQAEIKKVNSQKGPEANNYLNKLYEQLKTHQQLYIYTSRQLNMYDGIVDRQKQANDLLKIGLKYREKSGQLEAKIEDKQDDVDTTYVNKQVDEALDSYTKMYDVMLKINKLNQDPEGNAALISQLKKEGQQYLDTYNKIKEALEIWSKVNNNNLPLDSLNTGSQDLSSNFEKQLADDNAKMADELRRKNRKKREDEAEAERKAEAKKRKKDAEDEVKRIKAQQEAEQERLEKYYKKQKELSEAKQKENKANRQTQADDIVEKQLLAYKEIYDAKVKLSNLDENKPEDAEEIARQKERLVNYRQMYVELSKQSHAYDDIIDKEKRSKDLAKIASKAQKQMGSHTANTKKEALYTSSVQKAYKDLIKLTKEKIQLEAKGSEITDAQKNRLEIIEKEIKANETLIQQREKSGKELNPRELVVKEEYDALDLDALRVEAEKHEIAVQNAIDSTRQLLDSIHESKKDIAGFENLYQDINTEVENINTKLNTGEIKDISKYTKDVEKEINKLKNVFKVIDKNDAVSVDNVKNELIDYVNTVSGGKATIKEWNEEKQKLIATYVNERNELVTLEAAYDKSTGALSGFTKKTVQQISDLEKGFSRWQAKLKDLFRYLSTYVGFQELWQAFKQGIEITKEFDTAVTELYKVANEGKDVLDRFAQSAFDVAEVVGSTGTEIINAAADWERLGYSIDKASKLAEAAAIYTNVGDGIDIDAANTSLVSTIQGFQLQAEEAMSVVDRFNEVANNFPIDSAGIGEALQRSAASFNAANTDLSESIALITATNAVVQDPDKVGNMWKTVSARIRGATTELEEMGEETDGVVESSSKLRDTIIAMTGFDIMENDNTFKDMMSIIIGIGKAWKTLPDIDQAALLEKLAGKTQANALAAALENYEMIQDVYDTAEDSDGSALKENEKYLESIQGHLDQLTNKWQELWANELNRETINFFLDLAKSALEVVDAIGVLNLAFAGIGGYFFITGKNKDTIFSLLNELPSLINSIGSDKLKYVYNVPLYKVA